MSKPNMTDERFWSLIDQARAGQQSSASPNQLREVLAQLSNDEVLEFGHKFYETLCELNHWNLWGAGYVIAGGMGDDAFHYFRSWIIGKGKAAYDLAMRSPDDLAPLIDDREVDNELLEYQAVEVLDDRGIEEDPRDRNDRFPDDDPDGEPFAEDTVTDSFPKLSGRFS